MPSDRLYFLLHKPYGYLSQFTDEDGHPGLGRLFELPKDVYPVGRLDRDSEGLLILTNDRRLNAQLLNPAQLHVREYYAEVEGIPDKEALLHLESGLEINVKGSMYKTSPCHVQLLEEVPFAERKPPVNRLKHPVTSWLSLRLTEGKNRQVRKMTARTGHPTLRLVRVAIEDVRLAEMAPGAIVQISGKVLYKKLRIR